MKEADIRPQALFNRYLELAEKDIAGFFANRAEFERVPCPACGAARGEEVALVKHGFEYVSCQGCGTLYLSPRPQQDAINRYYRESAAVRFWESHFFRETADARRAKMFRPRALLAAEWADRLGLSGPIVDIGSGYGIFLEESALTGRFERVIGIEPAPNLAAVSRGRGFEIVEKPLEEVADGGIDAALATCFEVLEHVYSPLDFLTAARRILRPGGALLLTTLTVSGFDIQELWQNSKSVHPPHHINLVSVRGMATLFQRAELEILDLSTPGQLDVNIVENALAEAPNIPLSRFTRALLTADEGVKQNFQRFLQENGLSSHVRVVARRPLT